MTDVLDDFPPARLISVHRVGNMPMTDNINGGAIAIGHPLGGSGARLATTLLNNLEQNGGRYGLQVMCEAGGLANATIIEVI